MEQETIRDHGLYGTGDHYLDQGLYVRIVPRRTDPTHYCQCMELETNRDHGLYGGHQ